MKDKLQAIATQFGYKADNQNIADALAAAYKAGQEAGIKIPAHMKFKQTEFHPVLGFIGIYRDTKHPGQYAALAPNGKELRRFKVKNFDEFLTMLAKITPTPKAEPATERQAA